MTTKQTVTRKEAPPQETALARSPMGLLEMAIEKNADVSIIEKLMDLQERYEAGEARKAYVAAMAEFREKCPDIIKTRVVDFGTSKGRTNYSHAGLAETLKQIKDVLAGCGLFVHWETSQATDKLEVAVTCVVTHDAGHREDTSIRLPYDDSGSKNKLQAIGSAVTYGQRYTLFALLGLAALDQDDDGNAAFPNGTSDLIDDKAAGDLETLLKDTNTDRPKFMVWLRSQGWDGVENIPASKVPFVTEQIVKAATRRRASA